MRDGSFEEAGRLGLEPRLTDPKSAVLPIKLSPKKVRLPDISVSLERVRGFEPLTCCLGSNRSTSELYPQFVFIIGARAASVKAALISGQPFELPSTVLSFALESGSYLTEQFNWGRHHVGY